MKKRLIPLLVACVAAGPWANASPTPPPLQLWVMDSDGTAQRKLGDGDHSYSKFPDFTWSPDSTRIIVNGLWIIDTATGEVVGSAGGSNPDWSINDEIVFVSRSPSGDSTALYVSDPAAENRRLLVDEATGPYSGPSDPAWSPDGTRVAFVDEPGSEEDGQVFVVDSDGSDVLQLTTAGSYRTPVWSPNGQTIAYETLDSQLRVVNVDGTGDRAVGDYEHSSHPTWCPDGTMYFTAQGPDQVAHIVGVDAQGENGVVVAEGSSPSCGPDGRVAFSRDGDIRVVMPGEPGEPNMTDSGGSSEFDVEWSPDGSKMAFLSLPNFSDPTPVARTTTMALRKHLEVRGKVEPSPTHTNCMNAVNVQRIGEKRWRTVDTALVGSDGRFRAALPDRPGLYRAVAPRSTAYPYTCLRSVSEFVRHRH